MMPSAVVAGMNVDATAPAVMTAPSISIRGLEVTYREGSATYPALSGLDLALRPGEFVVVTGANESGKTTLCRVLAGFVPEHIDAAVSGSVEFDGRDMLPVKTKDRVGLVGYVFDAPYDQLTGAARTVQEEVAFGLENLGVPRGEMIQTIAEALEAVGIAHLAQRHPLSLSGGQTQRLALASVLALHPSVLVLDEPTSQLDPLGTREVVEAVRQLNQLGLSVVYVTHELEPVLDVADRFIVLQEGRAVADGPRRQVIEALAAHSLGAEPPVSVTIGVALRRVFHLSDTPLSVEECVAAMRRAGARPLDVASQRSSGLAKKDEPIQIEGVSFTYPDGTEALRDVSTAIDGGCICFIGENGSGKSTLMRHLNGLLRPTSGRVLIGSRDAIDLPVYELARLVGVAFQNPDDQLFSRTVRDEVAFGARNLGFDEQVVAERIAEALELMDLSADADRRPLELSIAARKRLVAASVIAMGSQFVVLDEPTSAQDAPGVAAIERAIQHLVDSGRTAVVVSHDIEFVARTADRVIALRAGSVVLDGDPAQVLTQADVLASTSVQPPAAARIGLALGTRVPPIAAASFITALGRGPSSAAAQAGR
jgi:energy-coupling factor transporter ATP-binding protein EcfA2